MLVGTNRLEDFNDLLLSSETVGLREIVSGTLLGAAASSARAGLAMRWAAPIPPVALVGRPLRDNGRVDVVVLLGIAVNALSGVISLSGGVTEKADASASVGEVEVIARLIRMGPTDIRLLAPPIDAILLPLLLSAATGAKDMRRDGSAEVQVPSSFTTRVLLLLTLFTALRMLKGVRARWKAFGTRDGLASSVPGTGEVDAGTRAKPDATESSSLHPLITGDGGNVS